jgi:hypothetical protein
MNPTALFAIAAASAMLAGPAMAKSPEEGQAKLAKMLEGRVAGKPQSCIRTFPSSHMTVIDKTALVFERGSTLYVNVPRDSQALDEDDALLTKSYTTQLCRTDIVTTFDRTGGFYTGNIFLGDFVPYKRVDS